MITLSRVVVVPTKITNLSYVNGKLTINKAELTVTTNSASREYGNANPTFTGTITGFKPINGTTETDSVLTTKPSYTTSATTASVVNTYPITGSGGTMKITNFVM